VIGNRIADVGSLESDPAKAARARFTPEEIELDASATASVVVNDRVYTIRVRFLVPLLITEKTFNLSSFMGLIMVIGTVAKNGILLLDADQKPKGFPPKRAWFGPASAGCVRS